MNLIKMEKNKPILEALNTYKKMVLILDSDYKLQKLSREEYERGLNYLQELIQKKADELEVEEA